jgi:hypothetical protein
MLAAALYELIAWRATPEELAFLSEPGSGF